METTALPNLADLDRNEITIGQTFIWTWCRRNHVVTVTGLTPTEILWTDPQGFECGIVR